MLLSYAHEDAGSYYFRYAEPYTEKNTEMDKEMNKTEITVYQWVWMICAALSGIFVQHNMYISGVYFGISAIGIAVKWAILSSKE